MRLENKGMMVHAGENKLFGVDFHDFIQKDQNANLVELGTEFGLTTGDVRKFKKHMERN
jgi:hypothetical protein